MSGAPPPFYLRQPLVDLASYRSASKKRSAPSGNIEGRQRSMPRQRTTPTNKFRRRRPVRRPRSGTKTWSNRPTARPTVLSHVVQRKQVPTALVKWALLPNSPQNPGPHLLPLYCQVPNVAWTNYTRGFDVSQVTSSAIRSKNITAHLSTTQSRSTLRTADTGSKLKVRALPSVIEASKAPHTKWLLLAKPATQ